MTQFGVKDKRHVEVSHSAQSQLTVLREVKVALLLG